MLPQRHRLRKEKDIQEVFRRGRSIRSSPFILKVHKAPDPNSQFKVTIVVPVRVFRKASMRNYTKRRVSEAFRQISSFLKSSGWHGVIVVDEDLKQRKLNEIAKSLIEVFRKASLLSST